MRNLILFFLPICSIVNGQSLSGAIAASSKVNQKQIVIAFISDSMLKTADGAGPPTPITGVISEWNDTAIIPVTSDSFNSNGGTVIPALGNAIFTSLGLKTVFVNKASSGSEYSPYLDNNNWTLAGSLYTDAITEIDQCVAAVGLSRPTYILLNIGVNDGSNSSDINTVETDLKSLFARLTAKYPQTPILVSQVGAYSSITIQTTTQRLALIRKWTKEMVDLYPTVYFYDQNAAYFGAGLQITNTAHRTQAGQNAVALKVVRWIVNSAYNEDARAIISSQWQDLTTTQKDAIEVFTNTEVYQNADFFVPGKNGISKNATLNDWCFLGAPFDGGYTWTSSGIATANSGSAYYRTGFIPEYSRYNMSVTDFVVGARVETNSTAAGTQAGLIGASNMYLSQEATAGGRILYRMNETGTEVYLTDTSFKNGFYYWGHRSGTTKSLYKDAIQVATATAAGGASFPTTIVDVGGRNNNTTPPSIIITATLGSVLIGKGSINISQAQTDINTLITGMQ